MRQGFCAAVMVTVLAVCASGCATRGWVQQVFRRLGLTAGNLRVDRLLAEVHHSGGDPLTLTRLFGLSDTTAIRYCLELGPLDQASSDADPAPP